jgi:hypothetical protein
MPVIYEPTEVPQGRGGGMGRAELAEYADALHAHNAVGDGLTYDTEADATKAARTAQRQVSAVVDDIGVGVKVWSPDEDGTFVFALVARKRRESKSA